MSSYACSTSHSSNSVVIAYDAQAHTQAIASQSSSATNATTTLVQQVLKNTAHESSAAEECKSWDKSVVHGDVNELALLKNFIGFVEALLSAAQKEELSAIFESGEKKLGGARVSLLAVKNELSTIKEAMLEIVKGVDAKALSDLKAGLPRDLAEAAFFSSMLDLSLLYKEIDEADPYYYAKFCKQLIAVGALKKAASLADEITHPDPRTASHLYKDISGSYLKNKAYHEALAAAEKISAPPSMQLQAIKAVCRDLIGKDKDIDHAIALVQELADVDEDILVEVVSQILRALFKNEEFAKAKKFLGMEPDEEFAAEILSDYPNCPRK